MDYDAIDRVFGSTMVAKFSEVQDRESDEFAIFAVFAMAIEGMDAETRGAVLGALMSRLDAVLDARLTS